VKTRIRIIRPSGHEHCDELKKNSEHLRQVGVDVIVPKPSLDPSLPYKASSALERSEELNEVLSSGETNFAWCARGGYGCSEIIEALDYDRIRASKTFPLVVGFSDISALHSALYSKIYRRGIHGPMLGSELWPKDRDERSWDSLERLLQSAPLGGTVPLKNPGSLNISGKLFGGCFSVLTNLIGTQYLPKLDDHILFFEDIGENLGRLTRMLSQWKLSDSLRGVRAVIVGQFIQSGTAIVNEHEQTEVHRLFQERLAVPVLRSDSFGHGVTNHPLGVGFDAHIVNQELRWGNENSFAV
jgi:muramoyltetrapeptide carboxypeptidase